MKRGRTQDGLFHRSQTCGVYRGNNHCINIYLLAHLSYARRSGICDAWRGYNQEQYEIAYHEMGLESPIH